MKISIVMGFFLPVPPVAGGAMEKIWWRLAQEFARRGHRVSLISRRWKDWSHDETVAGVRLLRVPGFDHRRRLAANLLLDARWGTRVYRQLPDADILVTNTIALPVWVRRFRPQAGQLVVNLNRYPKGQLRWYHGVARIQAASQAIADATVQQAPRWAHLTRVTPNPIEWHRFASAAARRSRPADPVIVGYLGRIHSEKGLRLLVEAARCLHADPSLPAWRLVLRGPTDIARGGGGPEYATELDTIAEPLRTAGRYARLEPEYDAGGLAQAFADVDVFCYPSLAEHGEALPVAVLEAMAAARPVVVTGLSCFSDYVRDHTTGRVLPDWSGQTAPQRLAALLAQLIREPEARTALGNAGQAAVASLDTSAVADTMLADFESLLHGSS